MPGLDPTDASEIQPQNRHILREVAEQDNETPDINMVLRSHNPSTKLDIYDDMAKNGVNAEFDIYNADALLSPMSLKATEMEMKMVQSNMRTFDGESAVYTDVERR